MAITRPAIVTPWADAGVTTAPSGGVLSSGLTTPAKIGWRLFNWLNNYAMNGVRYLARRGIADWSSSETYAIGDLAHDATDDAIYMMFATVAPGTAPHSDLTHWYKTPINSRPIISQFAQEMWAWRSARNVRRFGIDHMGFPGGRFIGWQEDWGAVGSHVGTITDIVGRWVLGSTNADGGLVGEGAQGTASPVHELYNALKIVVPKTANNDVAWAQPSFNQVALTANAGCMVECDLATLGDLTRTTFLFGFLGPGQITTAQGGGALAGDGAFFRKTSADANWQCVSKVGGVETATTSGVSAAAAAWRHLKVELHGSSMSEDFGGRALFYIDGVQVASLSSNLPFGAADPRAWIFVAAFTQTTGGTVANLFVGPLSYRQVTVSGDAF